MKKTILGGILLVFTLTWNQPLSLAGFSMREQRAVSKNNLGLEAQREGKNEKGLQLLEEAYSLAPGNATIRQNLSNLLTEAGYKALSEGDLDKAQRHLAATLKIFPEDLQALEGLGAVHYQRHNLEKARGYWEQALELDPDNTDLRQKLHSLEDEEAMDDDFRKIKSPHFDIRAEEGALEKGDYALRRILRNIYRKVSQDMKFFTQRQIIVLIYTESGYQQLRQTPHWSMGLFDGKIRIPIPSDQGGWPGIESIIRHEFTHALVWERTQGNCPPWLNEGLAQYEQRGGRRSKMPPEAIQLLKEEETLKISLEVLTNPFVEWTDVKLIPRGYAKSESLVRYLIRRYGMGKMHRILDALGEGGKPEAILEAELATTLAGLEKSWSRAVKSGNRAF